MKPLIVVLLLALVGCNGSGTPDTSSCRPCGNAIMCVTSLDACIVEGRGSCQIGDSLTLTSDGITNSYTKVINGQTSTGTWSRVDTNVVPSDGAQARLYEDGAMCPEVTADAVVGTWCSGTDVLTFFGGGSYWLRAASTSTGAWSVSGTWLTMTSGDTSQVHQVAVSGSGLVLDGIAWTVCQ